MLGYSVAKESLVLAHLRHLFSEQGLRSSIGSKAKISAACPVLSPSVEVLLGAFHAFAWRPENGDVVSVCLIPLKLEKLHDDFEEQR
jgi:hypothetical protein